MSPSLSPQVVKLHTKLGKPIPSTEPSVVTQTSSATTAAPSKASSGSSTAGSSATGGGGGGGGMGTSVPSPAPASAAGAAGSSYLKPVSLVNSGSSAAAAAVQGKSPVTGSLPTNASAVKKANTPKINFVGKYGPTVLLLPCSAHLFLRPNTHFFGVCESFV